MAKWLITLGLLLLLSGLLWPWLAKLGLGNLPGDLRIRRGDRVFHFPLASSLLASVALTLLLWFLR